MGSSLWVGDVVGDPPAWDGSWGGSRIGWLDRSWVGKHGGVHMADGSTPLEGGDAGSGLKGGRGIYPEKVEHSCMVHCDATDYVTLRGGGTDSWNAGI